MRCQQVERLLIDYLEGELAAADEAAVREHIAECGGCAAELAAFESTRELLRSDAYVEPSPFYWTRFNARLKQRMRRGVWVGADDRWGGLVPRLAPVAVAVLCFAVGMWIGLSPTGTAGRGAGDAMPGVGYGIGLAEAPVVSPRSKTLVASGSTASELAYAADTLAPYSYEPPSERSEMMLASSEDETEFEQRLVNRLLRD